jgi:D-alanyl-lipoteichoic acid acyltransferase DltB (MBOAT superfamily)
LLFNSWEFAVFLPLVLFVYYCLRHRGQNVFLVAASYFFYGCWDYRFCSLLAISTVVDYLCGRGLAVTTHPARRKLLVFASCVTNLGILGFFKYFNFFADSAVSLLQAVGLRTDVPTLQVILPVGISFYTFQTLSYTVDVYRGRMTPVRDFIDFALYVSFFPQLVAGPIERASRLIPQIQAKRVVTWEHVSTGCFLILLGLFRKVAIADGLAPYVNQIFARPEGANSLQLIAGGVMFAFQVYGDFAGYSDIARGSARLLGVELIENFQHPFFSTNVTEFWQRWHISLSSWLRDYLYIPLGGNRHGKFAQYRNLFVTMLLGGLWHGADWTRVIWGGLTGVFLAAHRLMLRGRRPEIANRGRTLRQWPIDIAKVAVTFALFVFSLIIFRAPDLSSAWTYLCGIASWNLEGPMEGIKRLMVSVVLITTIDVAQYRKRDHTVFLRWHWIWRGLVYATLILALFALRTDGNIPFFYFQF